MFTRATRELKGNDSDLVPFWCLPENFNLNQKIERIIPMYPFSQDKYRYDRLIDVLSLYRLTLGQPRQEELFEVLDKKQWKQGTIQELYLNLSPYSRLKEKGLITNIDSSNSYSVQLTNPSESVINPSSGKSRFGNRRQVIRRVKEFALNYHGSEKLVNTRIDNGEPIYWISILNKPYTKEFAFIYFDDILELRFYLANNIGQGRYLYNGKYSINVLKMKTINIDGYELNVRVEPTFKISNPWGKGIFDVAINSDNKEILIELFSKFCGSRHTKDNPEYFASLEKYSKIIDINEFSSKFNNTYMSSERSYNYYVSLSIGVRILIPIITLSEIDAKSTFGIEEDQIVNFVRKIENTI